MLAIGDRYRSRIQCCEWEEANDRGRLCRLDTGTVSLPSNTIKTATGGAAMVCGSPHQFFSKGCDQPCIPSIVKCRYKRTTGSSCTANNVLIYRNKQKSLGYVWDSTAEWLRLADQVPPKWEKFISECR